MVLMGALAIGRRPVADPQSKRPAAPRSRRPAKPATSAPTSGTNTTALQEQFRSAMSTGDLNRAAGILSAARTALMVQKATKATDDRARWSLFEAELELAQDRPAKAGLASMRVVVQRPKSEFAGEGLYWTAQAYERLGREAKATELYRECLEHKPLATSIRTKAEDHLAAAEKKVRSK